MVMLIVPLLAVFTTTSACGAIGRSVAMPLVYLGVAIKKLSPWY